MADDDITAQWIRGRLAATGATQRALAKVLGLNPSNISRLLEGGRDLKPDEMVLVRRFFEEAARQVHSPSVENTVRDRRRRVKRPTAVQSTGTTVDIPVYALSLIDEERWKFSLSVATPVEYRDRPPQLKSVLGAYGLIVPIDIPSRMIQKWPRFSAGETIYVHPFKPPPVGALAVLRHSDSDEIEILEATQVLLSEHAKTTAMQRIVLCASE